MSDNKRLTPAEQEIEKKLNPDSQKSDERSEISEARKLIDKEIKSDDK